MTELLKLLTPPVVGAVIGYFTNYVAIKMLFRPKRAYYIFGKKIPLTPGLIPSKRDKLALAIAKVVKENLLTEDAIKKRLNEERVKRSTQELIKRWLDDFSESLPEMSDEIYKTLKEKRLSEVFGENSIKGAIASFIENLKGSQTPLIELIPNGLRNEIPLALKKVVDSVISVAEKKVSENSFKKLVKRSIAEKIAPPLKAIFGLPVELVSETAAAIVVKALKDALGSKSLRDLAVSVALEKTQELMQKPVSEYLQRVEPQEAAEFLLKHIDNPISEIPVFSENVVKKVLESLSEIIKSYSDKISQRLSDRLIPVIESQLPVILESLDIERLVEEKVNSLPIEEVEAIVLKLIDEELGYITLMGGVLGFIIGAFQDLILFVR